MDRRTRGAGASSTTTLQKLKLFTWKLRKHVHIFCGTAWSIASNVQVRCRSHVFLICHDLHTACTSQRSENCSAFRAGSSCMHEMESESASRTWSAMKLIIKAAHINTICLCMQRAQCSQARWCRICAIHCVLPWCRSFGMGDRSDAFIGRSLTAPTVILMLSKTALSAVQW